MKYIKCLFLALLATSLIGASGSVQRIETTFELVVNFTGADGTGVLSLTDPSRYVSCTRGVFYLDQGGTGTVTLHSTPTTATPISTSTRVVGVIGITSTAVEGISFEAAAGFFQFEVTAAGTNTIRISCSNIAAVDSGGGGGVVVNTPQDLNGNGSPDYILARGGPGDTLQTLYDYIGLLTDTGAKLIEVEGTFDSSALTNPTFWDVTHLLRMPDNSTLRCKDGARLYGPDLDFWRARAASTYLVANDAGANSVRVENCFIENTDLLEAFDGDTGGSDWITSLFGGVHFSNCDGCVAEGNTFRGSPHSACFITESQNSSCRNNVFYGSGEAFNHRGDFTTLSSAASLGDMTLTVGAAPPNCSQGDWILIELDDTDPLSKDPLSPQQLYASGWIMSPDPQTTSIDIRRSGYATGREPGMPGAASIGRTVFCSEGDKQGAEIYTDNGVVAKNNSIVGNELSFTAGTAFQIRGVFLGNRCYDATDVTCWHQDPLVARNKAEDVGGQMTQVRGSRGATVFGNIGIRTGGVLFVRSPANCDDAFDAANPTDKLECSLGTYFSHNIFRDSAPNTFGTSSSDGVVRFNTGHSGLYWDVSNMVDGNIGGHAYGILGNLPNTFMYLTGKNIACIGLADPMSTLSDPITQPLKVSAQFTWTGMQDYTTGGCPTISFRAQSTENVVIDPLFATGTTGDIVLADPIGTYDVRPPDIWNFNIDARASGYSGTYVDLATLQANVACSREWEGLWGIVTTPSPLRYLCDGTSFNSWTPVNGRSGYRFFLTTGETSRGGGLHNGTFSNALRTGRAHVQQGRSGGSIEDFVIENVTHRKTAEGMLSTDTVQAVREEFEGFSNLRLDKQKFDGIATVDRLLNVEDTDWSKESIVIDEAAASGSCTSGSRKIDTDAAAGSVFSVCEGGTWAGK